MHQVHVRAVPRNSFYILAETKSIKEKSRGTRVSLYVFVERVSVHPSERTRTRKQAKWSRGSSNPLVLNAKQLVLVTVSPSTL